MKTKKFLLVLGILLNLSSCSQPAKPVEKLKESEVDVPTASSTNGHTTSNSPTPKPTPQLSADTPTHLVQFHITTTSDYAFIGLKSGGNWYELSIVSQSEHIKNAGIESGHIFLNQDLTRAEGGGSVDIVVEALIAYLDEEQPLVFEIERGHIGYTQVKLLHFKDQTPMPVTTFTWDGIKEFGRNAQEFEVSTLPILGTNPNEHTVIAQLNFWFYGKGKFGGFENEDGSRATPFTPLYQEAYYASDPDWIFQQIEWAVEYGVDAFSIEWTTPRGVGCCGSMEDTLDDVFLKSPNIHKVRWVIFYDFVLRMLQTEELNIDSEQILNFDQPEVYETFVEDFVHFAIKYFDHPQYLTVDDRPVIYIWATNAFTGNFQSAIAEARQKVSDLGYDVFIVGDEVCYGCFNPAHAALFDGSSAFTFLMPGVDIFSLKNVDDAAKTTDTVFTWWRKQIANLQVSGRDDYVNFQPAWAPQYNESWSHERPNPIVVIAERKEQVIQMAEIARKHAESAGKKEVKLIWVNTWNCWKEATTIEPTINDDSPKYPGGNYGFDFLEVIREIFGVETYFTSP